MSRIKITFFIALLSGIAGDQRQSFLPFNDK